MDATEYRLRQEISYLRQILDQVVDKLGGMIVLTDSGVGVIWMDEEEG